MNIKLTLRMDENTIQKAKFEAKRRGKSVSQIVSDFIESIDSQKSFENELTPITAKIVGILKDKEINEEDYKAHLREKYI